MLLFEINAFKCQKHAAINDFHPNQQQDKLLTVKSLSSNNYLRIKNDKHVL